MNHSALIRKPARFIDDTVLLARCIEALRQQQELALDLEFDSHNHAYGVTLCLIQVATPDTCYIIDPFAPMDLQPLYAVFEDAGILKIVHSPGEDLRLLHSLSCYPKNVFDTEIVARLLNYEQTSISVMLQEKLGLSLSKKQQRSNWLKRPLSPEQIQYAADDVAYLHALKEALIAEATPKGLMPFVDQEQDGLSTTIYKPEIRETFLKPADLYTLSPRDQFLLNGLLQYRDELARQLNKPAFHIMDESLVRSLAGGDIRPAALLYEKGVHRAAKTERAIKQLDQRLKQLAAAADAQKLSSRKAGREQLTPEQHAAKEKAARDRTRKFLPVQQDIATTMGIYAARFILSNTAVNDLLSGKSSLGSLKPYRRELILAAAQRLGIDLSDYA